MAFFGLVRPTTGGSEVSIASMHINVWAFHRAHNPFGIFDLLPQLGQHKVYVDVGLHVEVQQGFLRHLELVLPGGMVPGSLEDLSPFVLDSEVNDFIFGGPVKIEGGQIYYNQDGEHGDTVVSALELVETGNGIGLLVLDRFMSPSSDRAGKYYLRFRYLCSKPYDLIRLKPWGFNKRGVIFDLRINDIRSAPSSLSTRKLLNISNCYLFAILPISYVPILVNPALHYSRLLESPHWRSYLNGCSAGDRKGVFTTYYWKSVQGQITVDKPLRAFMHLQNEFGIWFLALYLGGIILPVALAIARFLFEYFN